MHQCILSTPTWSMLTFIQPMIAKSANKEHDKLLFYEWLCFFIGLMQVERLSALCTVYIVHSLNYQNKLKQTKPVPLSQKHRKHHHRQKWSMAVVLEMAGMGKEPTSSLNPPLKPLQNKLTVEPLKISSHFQIFHFFIFSHFYFLDALASLDFKLSVIK